MAISPDDKVTVTEEVDGGVQTVSAKLPMIVTTDLRYLGIGTLLIIDLMSQDTLHCQIS